MFAPLFGFIGVGSPSGYASKIEPPHGLHERMALMGIKNMSAYLRKISQDGFLYNVEYPGLHEVCSQIESISVNINQIAKRVNSTETIYAEDMRQIKKGQEEIWQLFK